IVTIEALITDAVKIRMMSDVPLGALLSGGIDSSLVCALMQKSQTTKVKTFSIGFDSAEYDESKHAAAVAQHLGTEHECLHLTEAEVLDTVPRIATIYDEPFADGSQIPTYLVSRLTRGHVTVALTGDGFDELFAGYARYVLTQKAWERIRALPLRNQLAGMVAQLPDGVIGLADSLLGRLVPAGVNASSLGKKLKHSGHLLRSKSAEDVFRSYMTAWVDPQELLADGRTDWARPPMAQAVAGDMMARLMLDDQLNYLPDDILCKVDRASMAVSLETRIPALDPRVAEAAWRIPEPERWFGGKGKSILRDILYRHVPQEIVDRPKRGFAVPLEEWLHGPLQGWAGDLLAEDTVRRQGILNASVVSRKWKDYRDGGVTTSAQIWTLLMFQAWMAAR
ncbi:MAG: 7-cyano-7-deazaguanine synthase, partial [Alphaproteobacteria bacterium]|nr:7-cyano-7-deazaguanine synthase [Alphaproteobacteria bacterium]